ncbi:cytidine deaminase [Ekhidna sp.]|uniref:cytidine deaminase n=1 Tax=Ekhidna sp. TaxID=2608089 RepID=UPI003CCB95D6
MSENILKEKAREAASRAYAPYSNFKVGCALLTKSGNVYTGCNVENASYGLTVCAERNAIANAINAEGAIEIAKIVVYTPTSEPTPPCGACRQVIHEFGDPEVMSYCEEDQSNKHKLNDLLPYAFKLKRD